MNNSSKQLLVIIGGVVIFVLLFSLCNPFQREVFLLQDPQIDYFTQNEVSGKVDILWVVDNSGSMEDSQENLARNFNSFINRFVDENTDQLVDFQMAIITTDLLQEDGKFVGGRILRQEDALANRPEFIADFQELVRVGTEGMGLECDLLSMLRATQRTENQHFFALTPCWW